MTKRVIVARTTDGKWIAGVKEKDPKYKDAELFVVETDKSVLAPEKAIGIAREQRKRAIKERERKNAH